MGMNPMMMNPMMMKTMMMMGGKGKGKGKGKKNDGLNKFKPDVKVWVGNLGESLGWKELKELFHQGGKRRQGDWWCRLFQCRRSTEGNLHAQWFRPRGPD